MNNLYTNRTDLKDFVWNAFSTYGECCNVQIASAFFSAIEMIELLLSKACTIQLIVRLGAGTSPEALLRCVNMPGVQIRYFSDPTFHLKLCIFGGTCCLVGSANLTTSGLRSNQEVSILLTSDDPRYDELSRLFVDLWSQAKVLDRGEAERFKRVVSSVPKGTGPNVDQAVQAAFGRHAFANIHRDGAERINKREAYLEAYRRRYQNFRDAFAEVQEIYTKLGKRLVPETDLPLRIEIDQLFNFIRQELAAGESYNSAPILQGSAREAHVRETIRKFYDADPAYLHNVANERYPLIRKILGTEATIESASEDPLYDALLVIHAFHDRFRFFEGGEPTMKREFIARNGMDRIKRTLIHLLHDSEKDYVMRIADCIFDLNYRLQDFGESCVQEAFGWINSQEGAICNGRTLKSLRWLGFDVRAA